MQNRIALIKGASRCIGKAIALELAANGATGVLGLTGCDILIDGGWTAQ